jgi:hypothetical protein
MKFTNKNNRWYDENDNSWEKKEDAEKYAPTLTNCTWCANCYNCTNCGHCNNCSYCHNCTNCEHCKYCIDCIDCTNCTNCTNCYNCYNCTNYYRNKFRSNEPSDKIDLSGEIIEIKGMKYKLVKA